MGARKRFFAYNGKHVVAQRYPLPLETLSQSPLMLMALAYGSRISYITDVRLES